MIRLLKKDVIWYENLSFFRVFYVITLLLEMVSVLGFFAAIGRCFALAWGMFIFVQNFVYMRKAFKVPYFRQIFWYVVSSILTTFLNCCSNFLPNLVIVYHSIICFFVFFGMSVIDELPSIKREMLFLSKFFFIFATFSSIFAIFVAIFKIQFSINFLGKENFFGIFQNRLVGFYTNSNLLAFMMVVSVVSGDILKIECYKNDKFKKKMVNCGNILNVISLFLSDSNASLLLMIAYFIVKFFCNTFLFPSKFGRMGKFKITVLMILYSSVAILFAIYFKKVCQDQVTNLIDFIGANYFSHNTKSCFSSMIGRKDYDIDSGRFTLWLQGLEIWKHRPFFGIGRENLIDYGKKYLENGIVFSDLHNGYLTILVSDGIVGFIAFLIFAFFVARDMFKALFNFKNFLAEHSEDIDRNLQIYSTFFSITCAYGIYGFVERTIFSGQTFMVVYFWLILGYTFSYLTHAKIPLKSEV